MRKKYKLKGTTPVKEVALTRKIYTGLAVLAVVLAAFPIPAGAGQTGSIKGRITDQNGAPLDGAYLYLASPAKPGISNFMTSKTGRFSFFLLPPGSYQITVERPGYKTVVVKGAVVFGGSTVSIDIRMEPSEIEGEIVEREAGSAVDRESPRNAVFLDRDVVTRVPAPRDFRILLSLVPGLIFENEQTGFRASAHGAPVTANAFMLGGVDVTDPVFKDSLSRINVDLIDQVVVETAALPVDAAPAQGAYIQVIHQSGGNSSHGSLDYTYAGSGLAKQLWSAEEIAEMGRNPLLSPESRYDYSLTSGGPVLRDISWYFSNIRYRTASGPTPFERWKDPFEVWHPRFYFYDKDLSALFKLSANVGNAYKGFAEFGFSRISQSALKEELAWNRTGSATRILDGARLFTAQAGFTYHAGQENVIDLSLGHVSSHHPVLLSPSGLDKPQIQDLATGYAWGSGSLNEREKIKRTRVGATLAHLEDRFLGLPHDLIVGGDYETMTSLTSVWKADNLIYNFLDGSPYTFGQAVSPASGDLVGFGLIGFWIAPKDEEALSVQRDVKRLGIFARDTIKIGRLSLSLGLRFDRSDARFVAVTKGPSGNEESTAIGDSLIRPVTGRNPYGLISLDGWEKAIVWNSLSPRLGLSWDLFGSGRTVFKGSFSRMPEYLGLGYSRDFAPLDPLRSHDFYWYDENGNGVVDAGDSYLLFPDDYRVYKPEFYRQAIDPDLDAPVIEEWTAGLEQEIFRDFTLSFRYVSRTHKNLVGNALYDPSTEVAWSRLADSPEGWWVPFTTVVPGADGYPDVPVTVHYRSATAPFFFERIENIPELEAKYRGFELSFRKRMSRNWQLLGSMVWSRSNGTTGLASPWSAGNTAAFISPNSFVNHTEAARLAQDRPFSLRLMGTVRFKWDIFLSLAVRAQSGAGWARSVTIIPPESWALDLQADRTPVTVLLEEPGTRRYPAWKNADLRLEKEFRTNGRTRFAVSMDVLNVLGEKYRIHDLNDGGTWSPAGEGAGPGERILSGTYNTFLPLWGTRAVRFNLSLRF